MSRPEPTPMTLRVHLSKEAGHAARVVAAMRRMTIRAFWDEAMTDHLKLREELGDGFQYLHIPRDVKTTPIYADEGLVALVDEVAAQDNINKDAALYTAFTRHVEKWSKKLLNS